MGFIGQNTRGGTVQMGEIDGQPGIAPMEMLLLGLAGCTGVDVAHILRKKRAHLDDLEITVRAWRADQHPKVYVEIEIQYLLWGDLKPKDVEQAIQLSEEKYCSASAMLGKTAKIHSTYKILPPEERTQ
ncbi:MAG TPA: OsmC family peroxiredoxin [Anaerolineales bacterium]|nr:OsmC family peroxiredoxin [Anaerolineales bacterium]